MAIVEQTLVAPKIENRHSAPGLSDDQLLHMYRSMLLSRALDERTWLLNRQGIGHFAVPGAGHEAAAVGYAIALRPGQDWILPHYRDQAALLLLGLTPREVMLAYLGKAADTSSGARQMFAHWSLDRIKLTSLGSVQGPQAPRGVGLALASKIKGEDAITWIGFGDGTSSQGDVHEAMNWASIHKLPCVFWCENNGIAISVTQNNQMAIQNVADRAAAYGMPGVIVDGNDPLAVYAATREAIARARSGAGPTLIEAKCNRLMPHTSNDDDRYRPAELLSTLRQKDPIPYFKRYLERAGVLNPQSDQELRTWVTTQVDDATDFAMNSPLPDPSTVWDHLYAGS